MNNVVLRSTSTTIHHRDDKQPEEPVEVEPVIDLESLTVPQLQEINSTFEKMNEACTEDCTQTNYECDVDVKDERDVLMIQIQSILQERSVEDALSKLVDMDVVNSIVKTPWTHPLNEIKNIIKSIESLNCQCTEEGNQTNKACDVQLKDERDAAIETLTLYMKSVRNLIVADAAATHKKEEEEEEEEETRKRNLLEKQQQQQERSLDVRVEEKSRIIAFAMNEIRDCCINNPGSKSIETMKAMLTYLEGQNNACTEDATQTNAECDVDVKAERDIFIEVLVNQIHDATICLNKIKAFASQDNNQMAIDDVMKAFASQDNNQMAIDDVMNTVLLNTNTNTSTSTSKEKKEVVAAAAATTTIIDDNHPITTTSFTAPTDEFVIQI